MKVIVLVPGIMGSELTLDGNEVWPPTVGEIQFGYNRIAELASDKTQVADVIRKLSCLSVYQSLVDQLDSWGFVESATGGGAGRLVCWPYDWRLDIRRIALALSQRLAALVAEHGPTAEIVLLAHSMGGLVSRYALEVTDAALGDTAWRNQVHLLVTMGTPHRGAPLALVRALGMEGTMGVSAADVRQLAADPRYPSAYQLIPPPEAFGFWNRHGGPGTLPEVDIFDPATATTLNINAANIAAARDFYAALNGGSRPSQCRYFNFVGRKLDTVVRGDFTSATTMNPVSADDGGDGTVPVWSGTLAGTQFQLDGDEHARTFRNAKLIATLGELLGVPMALLMATTAPVPALQLWLPQPIFAPGSVARVTIQSTVSSEIPLELVIHQLDKEGQRIEPPVITLALPGIDAANVGLRVDATLPTAPGIYAATLRSSDGRIEGPSETFAIQQKPTPGLS